MDSRMHNARVTLFTPSVPADFYPCSSSQRNRNIHEHCVPLPAHVVAWPPATIVGFAAATMTLSKTILYWAQEYYCNYCAVGHNNVMDLILLWIIPNGFVCFALLSKRLLSIVVYRLWIVVPTFIVLQFGKDLVNSLTFADKAASKLSTLKSQ